MRAEESPNHAYVLSTALGLAEPCSRILDFGCGSGRLVSIGRAAGHEFWGADAFPGKWEHWSDRVDPGAGPYVRQTDNSVLPFPDSHFAVVTSNQVFEHIQADNLEKTMREIARVLKPGGTFLLLFPTRDIWYEGHLGLYFPHRLDRWPRLQFAYLWLCRSLGFGIRARGKQPGKWAASKQANLANNIYYHRMGEIDRLCHAVFGSRPISLGASYMRRRLGLRVPTALDPILEFICNKRAGRVLAITRVRSD